MEKEKAALPGPFGDPLGSRRLLTAAVVLLLLPAAMLFFTSDKLYYPTAQWDGWALDAVGAIRAGTFADKPYIVHPPLYLYLLAFFQPLFRGGPLAGARLFNFACYLATGWLVFILSARLAAEKARSSAGLIGAALYYTSPLAVQGIFLLDLGDTGIVPVAAAAYCCLLVYGGGGVSGGLALAAAFALNLWAKLIHSFFIILAALAGLVTGGGDPGARAHIRALAAGFALFAVSWGIYAFTSLCQPDRWGPVKYFVDEVLINYQRQDINTGLAGLLFAKAAAVLRVTLWIWPALCLWAWRLLKRGFGRGPERFLNIFILLFIAAAWVSKGTSNGFPKYHAALLPAMCALCGAYCADFSDGWRKSAGLPLAALAVLLFLFVRLAGDPLYTFNYSLKEALINGYGWRPALGRLGLQVMAAPAMALVLFLAARRSFGKTAAVCFALAAAGLIWQLAVYTRQARGDYFTTYGYGTRGKSSAVAYLKENYRTGTSSGPNEFAWELKAAGVPFLELSDFCLMDRKCALGVLRDKNTRFFIFGQASNTVEQVKYFLSLDAKSLGRPFAAVKKGDFWIYDFNLNPAVQSSFHWIDKGTELFCRIPREAGGGPSAMRARPDEVAA